jgi:hypothetical protein
MGREKAIATERRKMQMQERIGGYGIARAVVGIMLFALVIWVWACLWGKAREPHCLRGVEWQRGGFGGGSPQGLFP